MEGRLKGKSQALRAWLMNMQPDVISIVDTVDITTTFSLRLSTV
jgi:hypothetical protein